MRVRDSLKFFVLLKLILLAGCHGGQVFYIDESGNHKGINNAFVIIKNCPDCAQVLAITDTYTTQTGVQIDGFYSFDYWRRGDALIHQEHPTAAVQIEVFAGGFHSRKLYHTVNYQPGKCEDTGEDCLLDAKQIRLFKSSLPDDDYDSDGLPDYHEEAIGTDPYYWDTDFDGILDGWEVNGVNYYDYNEYGGKRPDPMHKDIFIELDYQAAVKPSQALIKALEDFFSKVPVDNPDGKPGINLHIKLDDVLPADYPACEDGDRWPEFGPAAPGVRHARFCLSDREGIRGKSDAIGGKHFYVSGSEPSNEDPYDENNFLWYMSFIHELGHLLGLRHGGFENLNCKPNYPSIMNYAYLRRFDGSPDNIIESKIQFSPGAFLNYPLNDKKLSELRSFPGKSYNEIKFLENFRGFVDYGFIVSPNGWVDWNRNDVIQDGTVSAKIMKYHPDSNIGELFKCDKRSSNIRDHNDIHFLNTSIRNTSGVAPYGFVAPLFTPEPMEEVEDFSWIMSKPK